MSFARAALILTPIESACWPSTTTSGANRLWISVLFLISSVEIAQFFGAVSNRLRNVLPVLPAAHPHSGGVFGGGQSYATAAISDL